MDSDKIKCSDLKKCGEIATLLSVGKSQFFLNCGFCEYTFLQLENFIQHMNEDHLSEFPRLYIKQEESYIEEVVEDDATVQSGHTSMENDDSNIEMNEFESVEIEFDDAAIDGSLNIKEEIVRLNTVDDISQINRFEDYEKRSKEKSKAKSYKSRADRKRFETNAKQNISNYEENEVEDEDSERYEDQTDSASEFVALDNLDSEEKQAKSKSMIKLEATLRNSILNEAECILLAQMYKTHTCLWNETDIAYRFKNRRDEALKFVHRDFNQKTNSNFTEYDLECEITRLRKICSAEKREKILCKRNNTIYRTTCSFYNEIEFLEVDVQPFECSICGKFLGGLGQYKVHISSHDGSLPFKCHLCGHGFQLGTNLTVHLRRHVHDYTYSCKVCKKPCATATELKIHMRSHTGEKPFVCSICGYKGLTSSHLLIHTMRHKNQRRHKCKICSKGFCETTSLKKHMSIHSNIRDEICNVCGKGFVNKSQLQQHQLIHRIEKKYECTICGKRFAQRAGLSGHMRSHGEKW